MTKSVLAFLFFLTITKSEISTRNYMRGSRHMEHLVMGFRRDSNFQTDLLFHVLKTPITLLRHFLSVHYIYTETTGVVSHV